jgi:Brinker DNA-binding domain
MRYGTGSARERHHDRGSPSSETDGQESLRALAKRYGVNQKTVAKWRKREGVADLPTGP